MIFYTSKIKKSSYNAILSVVLILVLASGLFSGLFPKKALADNNYIDDVRFYGRAGDNVAMLHFHAKATFSIHSFSGYWNENAYWQFCALYTSYYNDTFTYFKLNGNYTSLALLETLQDGQPMFPDGFITTGHYCGDVVFQAGHTYDIPLSPDTYHSGTGYGDMWGYYAGGYYWAHDHYTNLTSSDYLDAIFGNTPAQELGTCYIFHGSPVVNISFPSDNQEIAGAFNVEGHYTIPAGSGVDYINVSLNPVNSGYSLLTHFSQYIAGQDDGDFSIPISGIPAGYYDIILSFIGGDYDGYIISTIHNIHIVNDIAPILPSGETTPNNPNTPFGYTNPDDYYREHSNYSTSTAIFNTLSNSVGALIQTIGNSLSDFAGKFSLSDAQNTATMLANSVSTIRSYGDNLNSFFGSLPVSEILFLYLIIFIAVIIFRLIKNLVNLIKP